MPQAKILGNIQKPQFFLGKIRILGYILKKNLKIRLVDRERGMLATLRNSSPKSACRIRDFAAKTAYRRPLLLEKSE